jgi:hypothetical protein
MAERELGVNRWQVVELHDRTLWETLGQISRQCLSPTRVPRKGKCQPHSILYIAAHRMGERCWGLLHIRAHDALDAALIEEQILAGIDDLSGIHVMTIHRSKGKQLMA